MSAVDINVGDFCYFTWGSCESSYTYIVEVLNVNPDNNTCTLLGFPIYESYKDLTKEQLIDYYFIRSIINKVNKNDLVKWVHDSTLPAKVIINDDKSVDVRIIKDGINTSIIKTSYTSLPYADKINMMKYAEMIATDINKKFKNIVAAEMVKQYFENGHNIKKIER